MDAINGNIGEGVEEILSMRGGRFIESDQDLYIQLTRDLVPVIIAFTKFDQLVSQILLGLEGGNSQYRERARGRAYTQYEQLCQSLFGREPMGVPAAIVSGSYTLFSSCGMPL